MTDSGRIQPEGRRVQKIVVIGAGIVGVPMAAMLADAGIRLGSEAAARVVLIQRDSPTSGWKVVAINSGRSPIGGLEPRLNDIVAETVAAGLLRASHDYGECREAEVILVCVQTDKDGFRPDYGPLYSAVDGISREISRAEPRKMPLVVFESTLAPTSLATLIKKRFEDFGLLDGKDILLGNSPNRVMPGRLVERIQSSDKIIGALRPPTVDLMEKLYSTIVTRGRLLRTNSLTAEIVKTLENAYRDVRIAFSAEIARHCDAHDLDFYAVRDEVNLRLSRPDAASGNPGIVPTGGLLIPTIGVGGHCLPKDGILLLWRKIEAGADMSSSVILESRRVNDESPSASIRLLESRFGKLDGRPVAILGAAYRSNSEDTRNSPSLTLARGLLDRGCQIALHDPFVRPDDQNLVKHGLQGIFHQELGPAAEPADIIIIATAHECYLESAARWPRLFPRLESVFDGCNLFRRNPFPAEKIRFSGIGKGGGKPAEEFLQFVAASFRAVETGFANEIQALVDFLNESYPADDFGRVEFPVVKELAATCVTGCAIVDPSPVPELPAFQGFASRLARRAWEAGL